MATARKVTATRRMSYFSLPTRRPSEWEGMTIGKKMPTKKTDSGSAIGYQAEPWAMADTLCGSMDSIDEAGEAAEDRDEYIAESCLLGAGGGRLDAPEDRSAPAYHWRDRWEG